MNRQLSLAFVVLLAAVLIVSVAVVVVSMLIGPHQYLFHFEYPYRLSRMDWNTKRKTEDAKITLPVLICITVCILCIFEYSLSCRYLMQINVTLVT